MEAFKLEDLMLHSAMILPAY